MIHASIEDQLVFHEGLRLTPYRCEAEKLTIGVGRNLEGKGITPSEAFFLLGNDIAECREDLAGSFPGWTGFTAGRQWALIDLRFNLGPCRFRLFRNLRAAANNGAWLLAGHELRNSIWWDQVQPDRRKTLYRQLVTGER